MRALHCARWRVRASVYLLEAPYDDLARQIGEAAYKVTDEQVANVVKRAGSERAAYELIVSSALGAGLHRWRRGIKMLDETML